MFKLYLLTMRNSDMMSSIMPIFYLRYQWLCLKAIHWFSVVAQELIEFFLCMCMKDLDEPGLLFFIDVLFVQHGQFKSSIKLLAGSGMYLTSVTLTLTEEFEEMTLMRSNTFSAIRPKFILSFTFWNTKQGSLFSWGIFMLFLIG